MNIQLHASSVIGMWGVFGGVLAGAVVLAAAETFYTEYYLKQQTRSEPDPLLPKQHTEEAARKASDKGKAFRAARRLSRTFKK